jgi:hypothetical protein
LLRLAGAGCRRGISGKGGTRPASRGRSHVLRRRQRFQSAAALASHDREPLRIALDPESQDKLMELLSKQPEEATLVRVGHRPELEAFHNRKVVLERRKGGAKLVSDIKLVPRPRKRRFLRGLLRGPKRKRAA